MDTIDLTNPHEFTEENVAKLLGSKDDTQHRQLRVTKEGIAFLSDVIGSEDIEGLAFRFEIWSVGKGYTGKEAEKDKKFVQRIYTALKANWSNPSDPFIDELSY